MFMMLTLSPCVCDCGPSVVGVNLVTAVGVWAADGCGMGGSTTDSGGGRDGRGWDDVGGCELGTGTGRGAGGGKGRLSDLRMGWI